MYWFQDIFLKMILAILRVILNMPEFVSSLWEHFPVGDVNKWCDGGS